MSETTDHRKWLVNQYAASSEAYDKALMALAGSALGLSMTFIQKVAPEFKHKGYLGLTWFCLALSLLLIFISFFASQQSLVNEMKRIDRKEPTERAPGGIWGWITFGLNIGGGILFIAGVAFLAFFVWKNV